MIKWISILLVLSGCATTLKPTRNPYIPFGVYQHRIGLSSGKKAVTFLGVNQYNESENKIVGLSPIGLTLFKFIYDSINKTESFYFSKRIPAKQKFFMKMFLTKINYFYTVTDLICDEKNRCTHRNEGIDYYLELNSSGRLTKMGMKMKDKFKLDIKVNKYENN